MKHPPTPEEAYARAAARCALKEYCRADWQRKLREAGVGEADAEAVVARLEREGFVDEGRYACAFVHDKWMYDRWGRVKIRAALRQKGLSAADVDTALAQIDEEAYADGLRALLAAKQRTVKADSDYARRQKLARFAAGRGFEPGLVMRMLDLQED